MKKQHFELKFELREGAGLAKMSFPIQAEGTASSNALRETHVLRNK